MPSLTLQQTIHGYDDGHQLLAASIELTGSPATALLILSDVSVAGASIPPQGYLTGYPLSGLGLYAIARTWSAPEMPRPGCVWTHTILIPFEDLATLRNCGGLLRLFKRPEAHGEFAQYRQPIRFAPESESLAGRYLGRAWACSLLEALYRDPTKNILVKPTDHFEPEDYLIAIWEQQWPGLRRAFRFCTHSMGETDTPVGCFDISVMPKASPLNYIPHDARLITVDLSVQEPRQFPDWVERAWNDLDAPSQLRRTFLDLGADVSSGRAAFVPLCEFECISESGVSETEKLRQFCHLLSKSFSSQEARSARRMITRGAIASGTVPAPEVREFVISHLDLLCPSDFDRTSAMASRWLFNYCIPEVWRLLDGQSPARFLATTFLSQADEDALLGSLETDVLRLRNVLELRPELFASSRFWERASERLLMEAAVHLTELDTLPTTVIEKLILTGRTNLFGHLTSRFSHEVLFKTLLSVSDQNPSLDERAWGECIDALHLDRIQMSELLVRQAPIDSVTLTRVARQTRPAGLPNLDDCDPWVRAYESTSRRETPLYFFCFLLARGFLNASKQTGHILEIALDPVYGAAEMSKLDDGDWEVLKDAVRPPRWYRSWDRCESLRISLAELCHAGVIGPQDFINCTKNNDRFAEFVEEITEHWWGQRYLKSLREYLPAGSKRHATVLRKI